METVFITGGSSGIGLATAEKLADAGYKVYVGARNPEASVALNELVARYANVVLQEIDVSSEVSVRAAVATVQAAEGRIDALVNNAGRGIFGPLEAVSVDQAKELFDVNVFGVMRMDQAVLPGMRAEGRGRIIYVSSIVGPMPSKILPVYAASKAALEALAMTQQRDLRRSGIDVTIVQPGSTNTEFFNSLMIGNRFDGRHNPYEEQMEASYAAYRNSIDSGQSAEEVADTIVASLTATAPKLWYQTSQAVTDAVSRHYKEVDGGTFQRQMAS